MEWIRCSCGNEEFKISKLGVAYCARCMKPLEIELRIPSRAPEPRLPEPKRDLLPHPDVPGYLRIRKEACETSFRGRDGTGKGSRFGDANRRYTMKNLSGKKSWRAW